MTAATNRHKCIAAMALLVALALATVTIAYGQWADTLTFDGSVSTASFGAAWYPNEWFCSASAPAPASYALAMGASPNQALFTIQNGYPGYRVQCTLVYYNSGAVPWKVDSHIVVAGAGLSGCLPVGPTADWQTLGCDQLDVTWGDGTGTLVRPGLENRQTSQMIVLVKDGPSGVDPSVPRSYGFEIQHNVQQCTGDCLP